MNTKRFLSVLIALIAVSSLLLAACTPATPVVDTSDPVNVVKAFYEAFNAQDIEKAMSLTAEDYVMNDPFGTYDRAAAAQQWQVVRDSGITFNQTNFVDTGHGRVTSCYDVLQNGESIDKGCGNVTHVREGKIIFDGLESAEQIWIVQNYYEALNAKQLDDAMSFIAPDALFINPTGTYEGMDAIRASLEGLNKDGITFELSNFRNTGGRVVYDYQVLQGANLLDQGANGLTIVKDGLVIFDGTEDTDPQAVLDSATVVQGFWEAMSAGNIDGAMTFVSEDVKCRGTCYLSGKPSLQSLLQGFINAGLVTEISVINVEGDLVTYSYKTFRQGLLVDESIAGETMQVKDGKIVLWNNLRNIS